MFCIIFFENELDINNITVNSFYYHVYNRFFVDSIDVMDVKHQKSVFSCVKSFLELFAKPHFKNKSGYWQRILTCTHYNSLSWFGFLLVEKLVNISVIRVRDNANQFIKYIFISRKWNFLWNRCELDWKRWETINLDISIKHTFKNLS